MAKSQSEVRAYQRDINQFIRNHKGLDLTLLVVDGKKGPLMSKTVKRIKWLLGFGRKKINSYLTADFRYQLNHPRKAKPVKHSYVQSHPDKARQILHWRKVRVRRGIKRRIARRKAIAREKAISFFSPGIGSFDGKPVAKWMIPKLQWARAHGWQGRLVSGWRSIAYSIQLCYNMCGRPSCPGRCGGASTNHVKADPLPGIVNGAIDVSDYTRFGQLMRRSDCPGPRIFNALGARDPVHFSPSGR